MVVGSNMSTLTVTCQLLQAGEERKTLQAIQLQSAEERKTLQAIQSSLADLGLGRSNAQGTPKEAGVSPHTPATCWSSNEIATEGTVEMSVY
jgi:hypothetical protein